MYSYNTSRSREVLNRNGLSSNRYARDRIDSQKRKVKKISSIDKIKMNLKSRESGKFNTESKKRFRTGLSGNKHTGMAGTTPSIVESKSKSRLNNLKNSKLGGALSYKKTAKSSLARTNLRYTPKGGNRLSKRKGKYSSKYSYNYGSTAFITDRLSRNSSKRTAKLSNKKFSSITPHRSAARISATTKENKGTGKKTSSILDKYKSKSQSVQDDVFVSKAAKKNSNVTELKYDTDDPKTTQSERNGYAAEEHDKYDPNFEP